MYSTLKRFYSKFSAQEKKKLIVLFFISLFSSLMQMLGIASIFPFIAVVSNPELIERGGKLFWIKSFFGIANNHDFLIFTGGSVLIIFILSNLTMILTIWIQSRFVELMSHYFSEKRLRFYLQEPYSFHLQRNSSYLLNNLTAQIDRAMKGLLGSVKVVSNTLTALSIIGLLILLQPYIALSTVVVLGSGYRFIYWMERTKLRWIGLEVNRLSAKRMKYCTEALHGIKELTVLGREGQYLSWFSQVSKKQAIYGGYLETILVAPRYLIEIIAFGGVLSITLYYMIVDGGAGAQSIIPYIALYCFAGYRLMPALQAIFANVALAKFNSSAIEIFCDELESVTVRPYTASEQSCSDIKNHFTESLELSNLSYCYPTYEKKAISNFSFTIKAKTSIGIVGESGAGKSTLVDIILGLLTPTEGDIFIDGKKLTTSNVKAWQSDIGYVPQAIFLVDASITENIAFGMAEDQVDVAEVIKAAKMANIHDFIANDLDGGYDTIIGERGIRLSGGQRQRIGIARALYHNPDVLILDEATSALDSPTEQAIAVEVSKLSKTKTILIIAHRLTTIRNCEQIIVMDHGMIRDSGTYEHLSNTSTTFQRLQMKQK